MWKYILFVPGGILFLMGLADWAAGALVPHGRLLLGAGLVALAVAGIVVHLRQKWHRRAWKSYGPLVLAASAIFGATDACAAEIHDVLIRPDITPIVRDYHGISGREVWIIVLVFVIFGLTIPLVRKFLRGCFQWPRS